MKGNSISSNKVGSAYNSSATKLTTLPVFLPLLPPLVEEDGVVVNWILLGVIVPNERDVECIDEPSPVASGMGLKVAPPPTAAIGPKSSKLDAGGSI